MTASNVAPHLLLDEIQPQTISRSIAPLAAWFALVSLVLAAHPVAAETRAILIGVSKFDHLKIAPLDGPLNDVALMDIALRARGLPSQKIIKLTDYSAENYKPRRANILRVFAETAKTSLANDALIVYFSRNFSPTVFAA